MSEIELVQKVMDSVENRDQAISVLQGMTPPGPGGVGIANGRVVRRRIALMDEIIAEHKRATAHISFYRGPGAGAGQC